ncbi:protein WVD2-like 7 isoform X2 [Andrographis paniculata]|uniref:protein WVD2-like 7 isoform X2 n=1 Tax=Andrographis paniculata TaxID=175694 RepID=UPI0021E81B61|nr:protein WVD2-like 7 isoform X2 [Andrographis paniculata]
MDEPLKSGARLEVSVSFGRFENDALSWEKWSSFSPNKYLEEAGSLSTPGSVAQKKAYFEAHYKKIAARKAELEREKMMESVVSSPVESSKEDSAANAPELDDKFGFSNGEGSIEEAANESCTAVSENGPVFDEAGEEEDCSESPTVDVDVVSCMNGSSVAHLEEINVDAVKCESSLIPEVKNELNGNVEETRSNIRKDDTIVEPVTPQKHYVEKPLRRKSGIEQSHASKKGVSKLGAQSTAQKVTQTKMGRTVAGTGNKSVSPLVKPTQASTPKNSKPSSMRTPVSAPAPKTVKKQVNGSPLPKYKNDLVGQSKRTPPPALHMSLSLSSANSLSSVSMTRKSLIMERMGDKDIVKRAFKAFQNRPNGSTLGEKPSPVKDMSPPTTFQSRISASRKPTKGNEGKDSVNQATQRIQSGSRSNPLPKGLHKSLVTDRKTVTAISPTPALRSDEKAEKRKEFLKQLEAKSIAREVEKAQHSAKSKVHIVNEIHPQRPTLSR